MNKKRNITIIFVLFFTVGVFLNNCSYQKPRWIPSFIPYAPALEYLPLTKNGYPDWVKALDDGVIKPRSTLTPDLPPDENVLDLDIRFEGTKGGLLSVVFPHRPHTKWLNCDNCHPEIFKKKRGSNPITMKKITKGQYCGRCHGKVAFPLDDCLRCHTGSIFKPTG